MSTLPIAVITGFLGSGKTTLLNRLLQNPRFENSLVIINEFGEVGIDHLLVATPTENIRLLSNGCLCCEVKGDLVNTLSDAWRRRVTNEIPAFDRIVIETSGIADPVPIIQTIVSDKVLSSIYHLEVIVSMVDAVHAIEQIDDHEEVQKQIAVADVLLVSKIDLVGSEALLEIEMLVREINPSAKLQHLTNGEIEPEQLFGCDTDNAHEADVERWLGQKMRRPSKSADSRRYKSHSGDVSTFTLIHEKNVTKSGLIMWLSMMANFKGKKLLRAKGIVNVDGNPHVVQIVQTIIHDPVRLKNWPSADKRTRIVFITKGLYREAIENTSLAFMIPNHTGANGRIDPAAYSSFISAAKQFI